jgi:glyoxylate/hydroxypyruvate reductase A
MKTVVFDSQSFIFEEWKAAFFQKFDEKEFEFLSADSGVDDNEIDTLLLWHPKRSDWRQLKSLQQVMFLGAGLDKHQHIQLPENVMTHKLQDSGMQQAMSEYALYAALKYQRHFHEYFEKQKQNSWQPLPYKQKFDFTIGVLGLGPLGIAVGEYLSHVGYQVIACSRSTKNSLIAVKQYPLNTELDIFLTATDLLIVLLPLNPDTHHLIDARRLSCMKTGSAIVNLSRGAVIHANDLKASIRARKIQWAMLDVFEQEPLAQNDEWWSMANVYITPHISAPTNAKKAMDELHQHYGSALRNRFSMISKEK